MSLQGKLWLALNLFDAAFFVYVGLKVVKACKTIQTLIVEASADKLE